MSYYGILTEVLNLSFCFYYTGILFSTLVFGPACGFILGSLCTKFYVDAIFIDTSESLCTLLPVTDVCVYMLV